MKQQDDKWLDALRDSLNGYRVKPSAGLWERIEADLPFRAHKPARVVPLWLKMTAAAAAVVVVGGAGWMVVNQTENVTDKAGLAKGSNTGRNKPVLRYPASQTSVHPEGNLLAQRKGGLHRSERRVWGTLSPDRTVDDTDVETAEVAPEDTSRQADAMLMATTAHGYVEERDMGRNGENASPEEKPQTTATKPENWYDGIPQTAQSSYMAKTERGGRWSVALTAMNGLPSVGGNTGGGGVMLAAMSDAASSIRPFGNSLLLEFSGDKSTVLLGQERKTVTTTSVKHKVPVSYGAAVRYNLTDRWGIESGLSYSVLNSTFTNEGAERSSYDQSLRYLELPVRVSYTLVNHRWFAIYAATGGAVAKCVSAKVNNDAGADYSLDEKPWQFSVSGVAGVQLNIIDHFGIYVEPGVGYYFDDNSGLRTVYKDHPWTFKLNFGLRVSY